MNAHRSRAVRLCCALALGWGLPGIDAAAAEDDSVSVPAVAQACSADLKTPKLASTSAAVIPDEIWTRKESWDANVRFRIDETGAPHEISAKVSGDHDDKNRLESLTIETVQRYKFCIPRDFSTGAYWVSSVQFLYRRVSTKSKGEGEMYIQLFTPSYTRSDLAERRAGSVRVAATFGQDGRPANVHVTSSSGDPVLEAKTLDAVSSYQLAFHDSTVQFFPMTLEHPFNYVIR